MQNPREWWAENVLSGNIDEKDPIPDHSQERVVFLTDKNLATIHDALEREFVAKKGNRFGVLHAVYNIRRAMWEVLEAEGQLEEEYVDTDEFLGDEDDET